MVTQTPPTEQTRRHRDIAETAGRELANESPEQILRWAAETFRGTLTFATSLGAEDQVLTEMIAALHLDIPTFSLDTGRLFPESYDLVERTHDRYGTTIKLYSPDQAEIEDLVERNGPNLFRRSLGLRHRCCEVRKLNPLRRALAEHNAWVCGLRREQAPTRSAVAVVEWDERHDMVKVNPLVNWSEPQIWDYIRAHDVPYNQLHDKGFRSIGCACCTRAVGPEDDIRAGRWWWEEPEQKECGLHLQSNPDGTVKLTRAPGPVREQAEGALQTS